MKYPLLAAWFALWTALALAAFIYIRLLYRWIGPDYAYQVARLESRPDEVTELHLMPQGRRMMHREGQFVYLTLITDRISGESHPFSISSSPDDSILRLSIKSLGDWTARIGGIREGTPARIHGPYGRFAMDIFSHPDLDVVLIGGGIGITPFLSIIGSPALPERSGKVWMIYSATDQEAAVYGEEIAATARKVGNLEFVLHLSDKEGYIDSAYLEEKTGPLAEKMFFICGPAPMMDSIQRALIQVGVPLKHISTEDFNLR
jgi:predicted ferric reductase